MGRAAGVTVLRPLDFDACHRWPGISPSSDLIRPPAASPRPRPCRRRRRSDKDLVRFDKIPTPSPRSLIFRHRHCY